MTRELTEILTIEDCAALIEASRELLTPSLVQYGNDRRASNLRKSDNYRWRDDNEITAKLKAAAAEASGADVSQVEAVDVVRYQAGGFFGKHHDGKHRTHTLCVSLSNGFTGGVLVFPDLQEAYSPEIGSGVLWSNATDETTHACDLVDSGEKWIAVVWIAKEKN